MQHLNATQKGMTIIELLVTLIVLAIVAAFAAPSFQQLIANNRMASEVNTVSGMIGFARSEASNQPGSMVSLCPSTDGASCSGTGNWEEGWVAFRDSDADGAADAGEAVLRVGGDLADGMTLRARGFSSASSIRFDGEGMPRGAAADPAAGTLIVCDSRGASEARAVVVAVSGQTRIVRDGLDHAGNAISCP